MSGPASTQPAAAPVLVVEDLTVEIAGAAPVPVQAVESVSLTISAGETVALVGESGSGKSLTALAIAGLLPKPAARLVAGRVRLQDRDLTRLTETELRSIRGDRIGMIFQEPMTALNPLTRVGRQIGESLRIHRGLTRTAAARRAVELLTEVRIPDPARRAAQFPHEMSGGMRQRAMIAMALACEPGLLIADEPTTALDVTVQAQILALIAELQERRGTAVLLITHDLGVVAETAQRVVVLYAGRVVETAPAVRLFEQPRHPYTAGLMASVPLIERHRRIGGARLREIPGVVPSLADRRAGCAFAPRCRLARQRCRDEAPTLEPVGPDSAVACFESDRVATELAA
ncbi:ABC transporter ATP-binding protein [Elioraea sp.]|uniref:ABC transporter ATP-binding protein n=1 Tax=Elioraea sp. TaxID=2185103 RepID=UPI003F718FA8